MKTKLWSVVTLGCAFAAWAHDSYILPGNFFPTTGSTAQIAFHTGDAFPDSEVAAKIERLVEPRLLWKGGSTPVTCIRADGKRDVGEAKVGGTGELIATVSTMKSLIELEPAKFAEYLKEEGLPEVIAWRQAHGESAKPGKERYSKYSKSILLAGAPDGFGQTKVDYIIEIVPEADPYSVKAGGTLPVQVLFRGKPAADLQIETAWAAGGKSKTTVVGRTNKDGRLRVPLGAAGRWRLHTIKMERCEEPAVADWESFWASLTFEVR